MSAAELGLFPQWFCREAARRAIGRAVLVRMHFDDGVERYHNGQGRLVTQDGERFLGVGDAGGTRVVSIGAIQEARAGVASTVDIMLSGVDLAFWREVYRAGDTWEGVPVDILIQLFEPSGQALIGLPQIIFEGALSVPSLLRPRGDLRQITLTVESDLWSSRAVAVYGTLSDADQKRRSPGDSALQYIGENGPDNQTRWPGPK